MQPDLKKFRRPEHAARANAMFKECKDIIGRLSSLKQALWFRKPVDPVADKVPNYHLFVKTPMDLGTIRTKLTNNQYASVLEFRDDVELVWSNCFAYNPPGIGAHKMGHTARAASMRSGRGALWRSGGGSCSLTRTPRCVLA